MCKNCIISHLSKIIDNARDQFLDINSSCVVIRLGCIVQCSPIATSEYVTNRPRIIKFPGRSQRENVSFSVIIRLCDLIMVNLISDKIVTVRDIYYQDVLLFRTQNVVFRTIEQLTRYFNVPRSMLNIRPSPNGLVAGDLTIAMEDENLLEVKRTNGSSLIPVDKILSASAARVPEFILVVEKEAVFSYLQTELHECIILTGKGFPDRATRNLLLALSISYPQVPIYGLVDSDPHGILILRNYEYGSTTSIEVQQSLDIQYLGISLLEYSEGFVPLTANDIRVAISTLKKDWIHTSKSKIYKEELQRGLFMGVKGEMNLLDQDKSTRLSRYVRQKIAILRNMETSGYSLSDCNVTPKFIDHKHLQSLKSENIDLRKRNSTKSKFINTSFGAKKVKLRENMKPFID